mgnify:CR=1 FL=1
MCGAVEIQWRLGMAAEHEHAGTTAELFLGALGEVRRADGSPVLGWRERPAPGSFHIARPLRMPDDLVGVRPTSVVSYSANLPAPPAAGMSCKALLGGDGQFPTKFVGARARVFLAHSLAGGQTHIVTADGQKEILRLRWLCVSSAWGMGTVWRLYTERGRNGVWRRASPDYLFDAGGALVTAEGLDREIAAGIAITHAPGVLTQYPTTLGLVKVLSVKPDGWQQRTLVRLECAPDGAVDALFSDNARACIGYSAQQETIERVAA